VRSHERCRYTIPDYVREIAVKYLESQDREERSMKAIVFNSPGQVQVKEVSDPVMGPEDVLIAVKASGLHSRLSFNTGS
jgi:hypothetical protein